jgi:ABC transporter
VTPILEARGLTKRFGRTQALAGLDLVAQPGRVVALLGPNGAGKTTFIRAVATLLHLDAGTLSVAGIDALRQPAQVRRLIGLAGQFAAVVAASSEAKTTTPTPPRRSALRSHWPLTKPGCRLAHPMTSSRRWRATSWSVRDWSTSGPPSCACAPPQLSWIRSCRSWRGAPWPGGAVVWVWVPPRSARGGRADQTGDPARRRPSGAGRWLLVEPPRWRLVSSTAMALLG